MNDSPNAPADATTEEIRIALADLARGQPPQPNAAQYYGRLETLLTNLGSHKPASKSHVSPPNSIQAGASGPGCGSSPADNVVTAPADAEKLSNVLGHPATPEWCAAVDEHHKATEQHAAALQAQVEALTKERDAPNEKLTDTFKRAEHEMDLMHQLLDKKNDQLAKAQEDSRRLISLLSDCYKNTNIRFHPELTGLASEVRAAIDSARAAREQEGRT